MNINYRPDVYLLRENIFLNDGKADVNISYVIKNYQNPYNLDSRLRKCEALNVFGDHCDPFFHFAAYTSIEKWEKRSTLRKEAGPFVNSKYIDHILDTYEIQPIFPDTIEIELDIQDSDIDEDQRIALFRRTVPLETKGKHEFRMGVDVNTSAICECTLDWHGEFCQTPIESKIISTILAPDIKTIHVARPLQIDQSARNINLNNKINKPSVTTSTTTTTTTTSTFLSDPIDRIKQMEMRNKDDTIKIVQLRFDNVHNIQDEHLDIDQSDDTLSSLTTVNTIIDSDQSNVSTIDKSQETTIKESDGVMNLSGQISNNETRNYIILAFIIIGLLIWLISVLIIGLVCYRRRNNRKVSVRKSALWTNINYEPNSYQTKFPSQTEPFITQYNNDTSQNTIKLITNNNNNQLMYPSLKRNSLTLPKLPINDNNHHRSVYYTRSSNISNKLQFNTITNTSISSPPFSIYTKQSNLSLPTNSCQPICDTYEELTCCINDHLNWKQNNNHSSIAPKLTSFQ
ncbi:hypothetical protein Smp_131020 [Schistosoma mansoni]|uniref:hypothetical protein n=1 Tax=Schistosoma mansoni TaxID=6183 RepID=UPI0001A632B7|nr:hypothetical protein Smp_131020 [Schistosoma mansoni]|eukprot:XP_018652418.1 hypothetical protein Smp_131020 [Schistosoma mansoni]